MGEPSGWQGVWGGSSGSHPELRGSLLPSPPPPRFIRDRVERCGDAQAVALSQAELGGPQPSSPDTKHLSECLRRIGDELDSNTELQRWVKAP